MPVASFRRQSVKRAGPLPSRNTLLPPSGGWCISGRPCSLFRLCTEHLLLCMYMHDSVPSKNCSARGTGGGASNGFQPSWSQNPHERVQFDFPIRSADPDPPLRRIGLETIPHNQAKSSSVHACHVAKPDHGHGHQAWKNKS